jgi:hypothetical protein
MCGRKDIHGGRMGWSGADHYEAGMRLVIFTIKARNGLLEDDKSGPDNQIKELGQTELRTESLAASNERCPEQT